MVDWSWDRLALWNRLTGKAEDRQPVTSDAEAESEQDRRAGLTAERPFLPASGVTRSMAAALASVGIENETMLIGKYLLYDRDNRMMEEFLSGFAAITAARQRIVRYLDQKVCLMFGTRNPHGI
jgi:hypothetical protein